MTSPALLLVVAALTMTAADDINHIERLATCQDSWLEFKDDPAKSRAFGETFIAAFTQKGNSGTFTPKSKVLVAGLPVVEAHPESLGTGVGFSVVVEGAFETAKHNVEKATGKSLKDCERGEGMRSCAIQLAPKKTLMVMSDESGLSRRALVGCYYYYEK
jgi:hypothetical protein